MPHKEKMHLRRATKLKRPQEPTRPYPYHEEEVSFENKTARITLSGTLTKPTGNGPFPAVLLIAGMGPNDRDYNNCNHKIFLVLADHLTRNNIAVLRYDKRGTGASTGTYDTTITSQDFADDARAGLDYLKTRPDITQNQIGLIGHSEGGMIASMITASSKDIAFLVIMAGATITSIDNIVEQTGLQLRADGASDALITQDRTLRKQILTIVIQETNNDSALKNMLKTVTNYWTELPEPLKKESSKHVFTFTQARAETMINLFNSPWYRFFLNHNPIETLKKITIPVLALNGDKDWITHAKMLTTINNTLKEAGNRDYKTIELPDLNHQFRTCQTGAIKKYAMIEETIAPVVLNIISDWILERTINKK